MSNTIPLPDPDMQLVVHGQAFKIHSIKAIHAHAAAVSAADNAALREDAERYRWLRDVARTVDWTQYINGTAYVCHCRIGPQGMDAAIDAARAALGDKT